MRHPDLMTHDDSPLPQQFFTDAPGLGGVIKQRDSDFVVEEIPAYEPSGEGPHLYLHIEKSGVAHGELLATIRKSFNVKPGDVGYAGMKDKKAVTRQMISIYLPKDPESCAIDHERIAVLSVSRHRNKLKRGHLIGNRFAIRIREIDPARATEASAMLDALSAIGAPAYYGPQRFGYRHNNHIVGAHLLRAQWAAALDELLSTRGAAYPEHQHERRVLYDEGRHAEAAELWTPADRTELIACRALARGSKPRQAVRVIGKPALNFFASATMSAVFNRLLDQRVADGTVHQLLEGDLAFKHDSRAVFPVTAEELATNELPGRLERLEISPSGPLWGKGLTHSGGAIARAETAALDATGVTETELLNATYCPEGGRRPFRCPIVNLAVDSGADEHGPYIETRFDLPRGMYATCVLREIMKTADAPAS
jgi:tRNA pseudouridine13 synthase